MASSSQLTEEEEHSIASHKECSLEQVNPNDDGSDDEDIEGKDDEGTESNDDEGTESNDDEGTESNDDEGTESNDDEGTESNDDEDTESNDNEVNEDDVNEGSENEDNDGNDNVSIITNGSEGRTGMFEDSEGDDEPLLSRLKKRMSPGTFNSFRKTLDNFDKGIHP